MMLFIKRLLRHPATQAIAAWLFSLYMRFVYITSRKRMIIHPAAAHYWRGEDNAIFSFWHGRMMMCPTICPPKRKMRVLISHHRDGKLISSVIAHFGQATVSGSSSKGGKAAVVEMLRALKTGDNISVTPDGPRGPAQVAAAGIITLARLSKKPILPLTFSSNRARFLPSWDRFMVALPFGTLIFMCGAPILVSSNAEEEEIERIRFEQTMNMLIEKVDAHARA